MTKPFTNLLHEGVEDIKSAEGKSLELFLGRSKAGEES